MISGHHTAKCYFLSVYPWKLEGFEAPFKSFFRSVLFDGEETSGRRLCTVPPPPSPPKPKVFLKDLFGWDSGGGGGGELTCLCRRCVCLVAAAGGNIPLGCGMWFTAPESFSSSPSPSCRTLTLISPFRVLKTYFPPFFRSRDREGDLQVCGFRLRLLLLLLRVSPAHGQVRNEKMIKKLVRESGACNS